MKAGKPPAFREPLAEQRKSTLRRQANEAFCDPWGNFSILKTVAIFTQIVLLYHLGRDFEALISQWEGFALVLTALLAPEMFGKLMRLKYGGDKPK